MLIYFIEYEVFQFLGLDYFVSQVMCTLAPYSVDLKTMLLYSAIMPKSEGKYVVKLFNWLEVHLSELTCYKVHTLSEFELSQNLVYSAIFTILISIFFAQKLRIFDTHKNIFLQS